ncbi:MAG TPA: hypothetical protein ENK55_01650 [Actinobacteria bacterium]|nr:hypothetical protein [Actinomycetota bacterium]
MAHIRRHPEAKGRWQVRYVDPSGRERARNFPRRVDAERFLVTVEADKLRGDWVDPRLARTTFGEWTDRWRGTIGHVKPYTRDGYESLLRVHVLPRFAEAPLVNIQLVDIQEWLPDLGRSGLSVSRIRQAYFLMGQILGAAVASGYLAKSPCVGGSSCSGCRCGRCGSSPPRRSRRWRRRSGNPTACSSTPWPTGASGGVRRLRCAEVAVSCCGPASTSSRRSRRRRRVSCSARRRPPSDGRS